jgi:hypothetical protein
MVALIALILSDICYMPAVVRQQAFVLRDYVTVVCTTLYLWPYAVAA